MTAEAATALKIAAAVANKLAGERTVRERLIKRLKTKLKRLPKPLLRGGSCASGS